VIANNYKNQDEGGWLLQKGDRELNDKRTLIFNTQRMNENGGHLRTLYFTKKIKLCPIHFHLT